MGERKAFLIRIEPRVFDALQKWASDDLRSLNGQIEFLLRRVLEKEGRLKRETDQPPSAPPEGER